MAVAFDGGVVLGADSRTTTGSYIASLLSFCQLAVLLRLFTDASLFNRLVGKPSDRQAHSYP